MDETNIQKNLGLSVKDIEYICLALIFLNHYYSQSRFHLEDYKYCEKLRLKLSVFKN